MACNCNSCPPAPRHLCPVSPCGNLRTGVDADSTGDNVLKVNYLGSVVEITAAQTVLNEIVFPMEGLNEHFTFYAEIYDPNDDFVVAVSFTVVPTITI